MPQTMLAFSPHRCRFIDQNNETQDFYFELTIIKNG
jgi:hypothetical protein